MILGFDDFELDVERLELRRAGALVRADRVVLRLLRCLARNAGRLVTKDELIDEVWEGRAVADTVVTVAMTRLRKTIGQRRGGPALIVNVYGRGYRFVRAVVSRAASAPPAATPGAGEPPFVGRERVMARLRAALGEAQAGRGRLCVLMGEPGIGKTRAVEMLERELLGSQARVAWGFCREAGDTPPLWPWLQVLREVSAGREASRLDESLGPLSERVRALLEGPLEAAARPAPRSLNAGERHRTFDAITRALSLASKRAPTVLVLEDLHRADAASLELMAYMIDQIARSNLLAVATLRPVLGQRAGSTPPQLSYVLGHRNCERVQLEPLDRAAVASYVRAVLDDDDGRLGEAVFHKSEGNPFFMCELARQLRDVEKPDPGALRVPAPALELVRQRIARLDQESRRVLTVASVIGRSFDLALLQAATRSEPSELMASLDRALDDEVVVAAPDSATAFAFGHELLRSVFYDALPPAAQRAGHLHVADALEQRAAAGDVVPPSELAYHLHAALPDGDLRKAVRYCRAASTAAAAAYANTDVVRYARNALEALELLERPSARLRLHLLNTIAYYAGAFDAEELVKAVRASMRLARERGDGAMVVSAAIMLSPRPGIKPAPGLAATAAEALASIPEHDAHSRSLALALQACAAPHCFDAEQVDASCGEAIALARASGSRSARHWTLLCGVYLYGGPTHLQTAAALRDELGQLARQHPDRMQVLPADLAYFAAIEAFQRGDAEAMDGHLRRCAARCRELSHAELLWHCERAEALARINAGDWEGGLAALDDLHHRAEEWPILGSAPFCAFNRAVLEGELGRRPALAPATRDALAPEASDPPSIWSLKLRALCSAGLVEEARRGLLAISARELARLPCDADYLGTLGHLARVAVQLCALDHAAALYDLLAPHADRYAGHVTFLSEGAVPQLLGMIAGALGRHDEAPVQLRRGLAMNERAGLALRAAEARAQLASYRRAARG